MPGDASLFEHGGKIHFPTLINKHGRKQMYAGHSPIPPSLMLPYFIEAWLPAPVADDEDDITVDIEPGLVLQGHGVVYKCLGPLGMIPMNPGCGAQIPLDHRGAQRSRDLVKPFWLNYPSNVDPV